MNKEGSILIPMIITPLGNNLQDEPVLDNLDLYYDCDSGCDAGCDCDGGGLW